MNDGTYTYETKCRRCGALNEWHFSEKAMLEWTKFALAMVDYITNPRQRHCDKCEKETIQDVVAYTPATS